MSSVGTSGRTVIAARGAARNGLAASAFSRRRPSRKVAWQTGASLKDTALVPVMDKGEFTKFPGEPGVYAVFDAACDIQYIGLSRKVSASITNHVSEVADLTHSIKYELVEPPTREVLTAAWKAWLEETIAETGNIPPGNMPGETKWQARAVRVKPEIKLTAGKAINVPIEEVIDQVVKSNQIVAFVKGTRLAPQCGFSHKMLQMLGDMRAEFEVVNVLDEFHNPGLREAIKAYSQWPTIPQLYIRGEFVGGADIVEEMVNKGELQQLLRQ